MDGTTNNETQTRFTIGDEVIVRGRPATIAAHADDRRYDLFYNDAPGVEFNVPGRVIDRAS